MALPKDDNLRKREIIFLKKELKRIEDEIEKTKYNNSEMKKLWELREKIKKESDKYVDIYITQYSEPYNEKDKETQRLVSQKRNKKVISKI